MPLTLQAINIGSSPGDQTGDPARTAFDKVNSNNSLIAGAILDAEVKAFSFALTDENETLEDRLAILGDNVLMSKRWPYGFVVTEVRAELKTETATGGDDIVLDIKEEGVSILDSGQLVIPGGANTSVGQSVEPVIESAVIADNALITIEHISSGTGSIAAGLKVDIIGYLVLTASS